MIRVQELFSQAIREAIGFYLELPLEILVRGAVGTRDRCSDSLTEVALAGFRVSVA